MYMNPTENQTHKNKKSKDTLPKKQPITSENKTNDPPGVHMPPEKEMSPPQLG